MICLISDISVGNFDSDCESNSQSPIFTINKNTGKSPTNKNQGKQVPVNFQGRERSEERPA